MQVQTSVAAKRVKQNGKPSAIPPNRESTMEGVPRLKIGWGKEKSGNESGKVGKKGSPGTFANREGGSETSAMQKEDEAVKFAREGVMRSFNHPPSVPLPIVKNRAPIDPIDEGLMTRIL